MKALRKPFVILFSFWLGVSGVQARNEAALGDIFKLQKAGLSEETIVAYIKSKDLRYDLSADDAIALRNQGMPAGILTALLASGGGAVISIPSTVQAPVVAAAPAPSTAALAVQPVGQPGPVATVAAPPGQAVFSPEAAYFYQELAPYGRWILAEDGQWYWQPKEAANSSWRPYWDHGRWIYTDNGWYWNSDYRWGWAAFHYGRWQLHPHHGWIWLPDRAWAPAWVVWRSGGEYCGWAPLPPHAYYDVGAGDFVFRGRHVDAHFDFGLSWAHFNFSFVRELGEQPRVHFRQERDIRRVFDQTRIENRYTVIKVGARNDEHSRAGLAGPRIAPFNHGIDPARVAGARGRALGVVKIHDLQTPPAARGPGRFDSRSKTLEVYRPGWQRP